MSWLAQLHKTYEQASQLDWLPEDQQLPPIQHTTQNAHIHIVIDGNGNFLRAEVLKKTQIVLPATEKSENRTSGEAPYPLADKLQYVAQDYLSFGGGKKSYFESYYAQLQAWAESEYGHPSTKAILSYVAKGKVIHDLVEANIIFLDENQKYLEKWEKDTDTPLIYSVLPKEKGKVEFGSALVAWSVEIPSVKTTKTWKDQSLYQSWIDYLNQKEGEKGFCYVLGTASTITELHPAKIRHTGDKAKLISANDTAGYTFKGRFLDSQQAVSVSAEVSQKAHAALRWLINIRQQAQRNGDQVTVAWALSGYDIPNPLEDSFNQLDFDDLLLDSDESPVDDVISEKDLVDKPLINQALDLGQKAVQALRYKLKGYAAKLSDWDQLTVLSLDSATTGRMAITYYQQFMPADYFQALEQWQTDFAWFIRHSIELPAEGNKKPKNKTVYPFVAPTPYVIAQAAFGKALTDEFKKQTIQRLLPNILEPQRAFPLDIVKRCFALACNRQGFEPWEWQRNLGVTCALYKGYYARHSDIKKRRSFNVALDENNHSRDYLYGRLLAVAEEIESLALYIAGENRATSAERYFQQFANRPFTTWLTISIGLRPYQDRLRNSRAGFLKNREDEITLITSKFESNDFKNDTKLSGEFLLGYHNQKMSYQQAKSTKAESAEHTTA